MDRRARIALAALVLAAACSAGWALLGRLRGPERAAAAAWPAESPPRAPPRGPQAALEDPAQVPSGARAASLPPAAAARSEALEVTVLDAARQPLPGARVRCSTDTEAVEGTTDDRGRALVALRGATARARVSAEKPGFFHVERELDTAGGIELTLQRATFLTGRVEDQQSGEPIAGAKLSFRHEGCTSCPPEQAACDAAGTYRFDLFPTGRQVELLVEAEGYLSVRASLAARPEALGAERDVVLSRGLAIALTVLDAETRSPLEGAEVYGVRGPLLTDAAGRVASDELVSSGGMGDDLRARLDIAAPGYCQLTLFPDVAELAATPEMRVPMVRSVTILGSVLDVHGRGMGPVELTWDAGFRWESRGQNARPVALQRLGEYLATGFPGLPPWALGRERAATEKSFLAGADGRFALRGAVPWTPEFSLVARAADGTRGVAALALPGPGGTAEAVIHMRHGAPSPTTAVISGQLMLNGMPAQGRVHWRGATRRGSAPADGLGRYELLDVEPGTVELRVQGEPFLARSTCALAELGPFSVYAAAGEELEHDLEITLPMAAIAGRVIDSKGAPVTDLLVEARDHGRCWRQRGATDAQGRFTLPVPAALPALEVVVERAPERLTRIVAPGSEGVDFVLSELGRLRFRVLDAGDGSPIRAGALLWRGPGTSYQELTKLDLGVPEPGGWLTVDCVAGRIELAFVADREQHAPLLGHPVVVHPGATCVTELWVHPSLSLRVVLAKGSIAPPKELACVVVPESLWPLIDYDPKGGWNGLAKFGPYDELRFNASGKAIARGLRAGSYRFKVWPEGVRIEPERVQLSGNEREVTLAARLRRR